SRFPPRQRFSPQALPLLPVPLRLSSGSRASEQSRVSYKSQRRSPSPSLPARSAPSLPGFDLRVVSCPCCLLFGGPDSTYSVSPVSAGSTTDVPQYGYTAGGKRTSTENLYDASCRSEVRNSIEPNRRRKQRR